MIRLLTALALASVLATASQAQGSEPPLERQGFGISFGLGAGSAGAECSSCTSDRTTGLSGYLRLGGHLNPSLFLGFESNGWTASEDGLDESLGFYSGVIQWYPNPSQGFYLKGGLGLALYGITDGVDEASSSGFGITAGIGYDVRVGRNFSLTPFVNFMTSTKSELKINDISTGVNASANLIQFGLGFTWH